MTAGTRDSTVVPFVDLELVHAPIAGELVAQLSDLIRSGAFVNGPQVREFEGEFAAWCGVALCVGTASGLDALRLALIALDVGRGDEVVVPAQTFVATIEAVSQARATPVLVDIGENDWNLDVDAVEAVVTPRTRAVLPVHLYGQMADMSRLAELAARHELSLVEDACQAHGAERDGIAAGTGGTAAAFSFYASKNLGAMGDAGALVTADAGVADAVRALREHGQRRKYEHDVEGWTARLDTIQAIVLRLKLPLLEAWNEQRRHAAASYDRALQGVGDLILPPVPSGSAPVWHLYVVRTSDPDRLASFLAKRGISTGRHYPHPVHLTRAYAGLGYRAGQFPAAEALARECLSLPIFPGIREDQLVAVADAVAEYFGRNSRG